MKSRKFLAATCLKAQWAATRSHGAFQHHLSSTYNEVLEKNMQALSIEEIEEVSGGNLPESSVGGESNW
ncbi:hypothetical protein [Janthinobacterium sp. J1-1]|uniref:hypothetical protein n=1 Tax=unclassified Janthinobacterium TaxID=2610881 RepID=UPI00281189B8|nr:hypothetical protein [Janthinobacterium sp. J1-1]